MESSVSTKHVGVTAVATLAVISGCAGLSTSAGTSRCIQTTISALGEAPARYSYKRVCVEGFLGKMVPYGETSTDIFETAEQAETLSAPYYLQLGIRLDVTIQERLARYSRRRAEVEGIFEYDPDCWPNEGEEEPEYNCYPPRPMRILDARIQFEDGTRFP